MPTLVGLPPSPEGKVCRAEARCAAAFPLRAPIGLVVFAACLSGPGRVSGEKQEVCLGRPTRVISSPRSCED